MGRTGLESILGNLGLVTYPSPPWLPLVYHGDIPSAFLAKLWLEANEKVWVKRLEFLDWSSIW